MKYKFNIIIKKWYRNSELKRCQSLGKWQNNTWGYSCTGFNLYKTMIIDEESMKEALLFF